MHLICDLPFRRAREWNSVAIFMHSLKNTVTSWVCPEKRFLLHYRSRLLTLGTITLTHSAARLSGLCLLTFHVLLMSLNPYELFYLKPLLIVGIRYS